MKNVINTITEYDDGTMDVSAEGATDVRSITSLLKSFKKPRDYLWLVNHLLKEIEKADLSVKRYQAYFQKNKPKLYKYQRQYREQHPEYEAKRRERARLHKKQDGENQ